MWCSKILNEVREKERFAHTAIPKHGGHTCDVDQGRSQAITSPNILKGSVFIDSMIGIVRPI